MTTLSSRPGTGNAAGSADATNHAWRLPIFIVNLDRAPERLSLMQQAFGEKGLTFTRVPAVDGRLLSEDERNQWCPRPGRFWKLGPGEIGCFLSHRRCWELIAEGTADYAAIFEDDVILADDAKTFLQDWSWVSPDADIVKLDTYCHRTTISKTTIKLTGRYALARLRATHVSGAGYLVSRRAAVKLLALSSQFADPLDHFLFNPISILFSSLAVCQLIPAICIQRDLLRLGTMPSALLSDLGADRGRPPASPLHHILARKLTQPVKKLFRLANRLRMRFFGPDISVHIPFADRT